jgi:hypothetical protein
MVAILAQLFYLVPAKPPRQIPVAYGSPRSPAVTCPVPVAVTEEVIVVVQIEKVIGQPHRHIKAKRVGSEEVDVFVDLKTPGSRVINRFTDNDLLSRCIAKVEIDIDPDVVRAGS